MPTSRTRRRRSPNKFEPEVLRALRAGREPPYSRQAKVALTHAIYIGPALGEPRLPANLEQRALALSRKWHAHEATQREPRR